ncbi:MAG: hypothetical protein K8U57_12825 [Planctomycetes bacterium]|nr:hypothetical protein [Planctomycetota bacterium]
MKHVIFLNRWGLVFHVMLSAVTEGGDRNVSSRICLSHDEARRLIDQWQRSFDIADDDVHDNSRLDMNEIFSGATTDFDPSSN